jgi:anthranilate phosphoribosyltransferase
MDVRRELGVRTVFNILGPLANPACAEAQLIGVFDPVLTEVMAEALCELGTTRAMAVHSQGMDEIGLGRTKISELASGSLRTYFIEGSDFGFSAQHIPRVRSPTESAAIVIDVLRGVKGAARDIALINAAAAIYLGGKAENLEEGLVLAGNSVDSGGALTKLEALKGVSG